MTHTTEKQTPEFGAVWREQLSMVGLAVRRESILAISVLLFFCVGGVALARVPALVLAIDGEMSNFVLNPGEPGPGLVMVVTALIFALIVWKGERAWGATPIWSLPVNHRTHALTKVAAGWVWLMALLGGALVAVSIAVLVGGGTLGVEETRQLITDEAGFFAGAADTTREVVWSTPWWEWLLPFTSATSAYLFVSALLLGTAHPIRWAIVLYVVSYIPVIVAILFEIAPLIRGMESLAWFIGGDDFFRSARLDSGDRAYGWVLLPSIKMWLGWATVSIGMGVTAVLGASSRARDH